MWQGCTDQGHVGPISKVIKKEGGSLGRRKSIRSVGFSIFRNREIHEIFLDMGTLTQCSTLKSDLVHQLRQIY